MKVKLTARIRVLDYYRGGSKFEFWKNLQPDEIVLITLASTYSQYATTFNLEVEGTDKKFTCTANALDNYLEKMAYEEC